MNLDWRLGKGEGPSLGGMKWLENFGVNVLYNVASGTPFTPTFTYDEVTLAAVSGVPSGPAELALRPVDEQHSISRRRRDSTSWASTRSVRLGAESVRHHESVRGLHLDRRGEHHRLVEHRRWSRRTSRTRRVATRCIACRRQSDGYSNPRLVRFGLRTSF
jgi:hypothetical protein